MENIEDKVIVVNVNSSASELYDFIYTFLDKNWDKRVRIDVLTKAVFTSLMKNTINKLNGPPIELVENISDGGSIYDETRDLLHLVRMKEIQNLISYIPHYLLEVYKGLQALPIDKFDFHVKCIEVGKDYAVIGLTSKLTDSYFAQLEEAYYATRW